MRWSVRLKLSKDVTLKRTKVKKNIWEENGGVHLPGTMEAVVVCFVLTFVLNAKNHLCIQTEEDKNANDKLQLKLKAYTKLPEEAASRCK